jgi:hypothetical protein
MKKFKLFWINGETEIVEGLDISDAMRNAGYSAGAIKAVDYWKELKGE